LTQEPNRVYVSSGNLTGD